MLILVLVLAGCSVWLELKLFQKVPALRKVVGKWALVGIAISLALSYFLGAAFGAGGIIVLMAGLLSTAIAEPFRRTFNQASAVQAKVEKLNYWKKNTEETYHYVLVGIKWLCVLLLAPLWLPVWYHEKKKKDALNA